MAVLKSPVFVICLVLLVVHQIMQKGLNLHFPLADMYIDNVVAMPVILTLLLVERRWLFKKGEQYFLPAFDVIVATIYIIAVTEIIFPLLSTNFTGDWVDGLLYAFGSLIFFYTINRKKVDKTH